MLWKTQRLHTYLPQPLLASSQPVSFGNRFDDMHGHLAACIYVSHTLPGAILEVAVGYLNTDDEVRRRSARQTENGDPLHVWRALDERAWHGIAADLAATRKLLSFYLRNDLSSIDIRDPATWAFLSHAAFEHHPPAPFDDADTGRVDSYLRALGVTDHIDLKVICNRDRRVTRPLATPLREWARGHQPAIASIRYPSWFDTGRLCEALFGMFPIRRETIRTGTVKRRAVMTAARYLATTDLTDY